MQSRVQNTSFYTAAVVAILLALPAHSQEEDFPYVNQDGDEVFGEDYQPSSPTEESLPYWMGRPNSGAIVPDILMSLPQDAFRASPEFYSVPDAGRGFPTTPFAPMRNEFKRPIIQQNQVVPQDDGSGFLPLQRQATPQGALTETMTAHFVDVGQGDGAILEFPCGVAVVDLGGEFGTQTKGGELFVAYLEEFFEDRPHLQNTIDVIFITHPHADHIAGMRHFFDGQGNPKFRVGLIVDNGQTGTQGSLRRQTEFRQNLIQGGANYTAVQLARQVTATGVTNNGIDPIRCDQIDPILTVFWGGVDEDTGIDGPYRNPNNHSVILRVDFGEASFLFSGDLEDKGEEDLLEEFQENLSVFDVDVYQVSHHGADDDTSDTFLEVMSPKIAVISMGKGVEDKKHTAWDHGHPRSGLLEVLQDEPGVVADPRDDVVEHETYARQEMDPVQTRVHRAIYGTGWSGHIIIEATGGWRILRYRRIALRKILSNFACVRLKLRRGPGRPFETISLRPCFLDANNLRKLAKLAPAKTPT